MTRRCAGLLLAFPTILLAVLFGALAAPRNLNAQAVGAPVRATESLRIRGEPIDLISLRWVVGMPDGRIAGGSVIDGTIRWFDAKGQALGSSGRRGEGPGEFSVMGAAGRLGDTLWVLDGALSRVTLFLPGTPSPPKVVTISIPTGIESRGVLARPVVGSVRALMVGRQLLFHGVEPADPASGVGGLRRLVLTDSVARSPRALPPFAPPGQCEIPFTTAKRRGFVGVMFCAQPILQTSQTSDRIAVVTSDNSGVTVSSITVRLYSATGRLLLDRALQVPARPIPRQLADSIQRSLLEGARSPEEKSARNRAKIPPAYPPLTDVVLADDGSMWLGLSTAATDRTWIVFDAKGVRGRDVILPKKFRPTAVVGRDILGTELDENDYVDIVRYRIGS